MESATIFTDKLLNKSCSVSCFMFQCFGFYNPDSNLLFKISNPHPYTKILQQNTEPIIVNNISLKIKKNEPATHSIFVILYFTMMNDSIIRYQYNPMLTDTVSFFDFCIPLTNESSHPTSDSLKKYYDLSIYNYITPTAQNQLIETTSVFKPHNLEPKHSGPLPINHQSTNWITIIFVVCLFIFAWIQTTSSKRLNQVIRAVAQSHNVNQLERDGNIFKQHITIGLGLNYFLISSVFIFLVSTQYSIVPAGMKTIVFIGIIFLGLFLYQLLKLSVIYVSGVIFETSDAARKYQLIILIFNYVTGIILFPITVIAFYWESSATLITGIIIMSLLITYRVIRGFLSGQDNKSYSLFYFFLYLCTLEILPLLLLFKALSKT